MRLTFKSSLRKYFILLTQHTQCAPPTDTTCRSVSYALHFGASLFLHLTGSLYFFSFFWQASRHVTATMLPSENLQTIPYIHHNIYFTEDTIIYIQYVNFCPDIFERNIVTITKIKFNLADKTKAKLKT